MSGTSNGSKSDTTTYWQRVLYHRSRNKPLNNIVRYWRSGDISFKQRLRKTYLEVALFYNGIKKILEEIRLYGGFIRKEYGVSKTRQFLQQFYLYFVIGVEWTHSFYRKYLLFKVDRWRSVRDFTYFNEPIERYFIVKSLPGVEEYKDDYDLLGDKVQFYKHCREFNLPTPPIMAEIEINNNEKLIPSERELALPEEDIFIKSKSGSVSVGISKFYYRNKQYEDVNGEAYNSKKIFEFLQNMECKSRDDGKKEFIIQPVLKNHQDWLPYTTGALSCCRVLTARNPNNKDITPILSCLRMPTGNSITDIPTEEGGIACPIDIHSGEMGRAISSVPINGSFEFERHPDTGQDIKGSILPNWNELLEFVTHVHQTFDFIFVGWDIAYTTKGFYVIEGNGIWGSGVESVNGRPLSKTVYPLLFNEWMEYFTERDVEINSKADKI